MDNSNIKNSVIRLLTDNPEFEEIRAELTNFNPFNILGVVMLDVFTQALHGKARITTPQALPKE